MAPTICQEPDTFFVAGGNLMPDAHSYVVRPADDELYNSIASGNYSYVLTSRQMGKSSLMHRTAQRLQANGITPVLLDLTSIGANLTLEQWYFGLMAEIGAQLGLKTQLERYWMESALHGPLYRFTHALSEVVLANVDGPIAIFIDEIDFVRGLRFSTDEFFAAIRHCYNNRAAEPSMKRLTFCLLGVATPANLIQDVHTTPFNIGRQIELTDFSRDQAEQLEPGLSEDSQTAAQLLDRVMYWTSGHPYLTQKLCLAVSEKLNPTIVDVDTLCDELFLASGRRSSEDNLIFVHNTLCSAGEESVAVIRRYERVLSGRFVPNKSEDPIVAQLRLAGVVKASGERLVVRNLIYRRMFNNRWVHENLPESEARRERNAYLRGLCTALALTAFIAAVMGFLVYNAWRSARAARDARRDTQAALQTARHIVGIQDLNLTQQSLEDNDLPAAATTLDDCAAIKGEDFGTRWEWRWLRGRCQPAGQPLLGHKGFILALRFIDDGRTLVSVGDDRTIRYWDVATKSQVRQLNIPLDSSAADISPDGALVAIEDPTSKIHILSLPSLKPIAKLGGDGALLRRVQFAQRGRRLASVTSQNSFKLWDIQRPGLVKTFEGHSNAIDCMAFSSDNRFAATGSSDGTARLWDIETRRCLHVFGRPNESIVSVAFSPDGRLLAIGSNRGATSVFALSAPYKELRTLAQSASIFGLAFSPSSKTLATCSQNYTVRIWQIATGKCASTLPSGTCLVNLPQFAPDGKTVAVASTAGDGAIYLWPTTEHQDVVGLNKPLIGNRFCSLTPDLRGFIAESDSGEIIGWSTQSGKRIFAVHTDQSGTCSFALFPYYDAFAVQENGRAIVRSAANGSFLWSISDDYDGTGMLAAPSSSPDFAISEPGRPLAVYDGRTRNVRRLFPGSKGIEFVLRFSADGSRIMVSSSNGVTEVRNTKNGHQDFSLSLGTNGMMEGIFSPDGNSIAYSTFDRTVTLAPLQRGAPRIALRAENGEFAMAFSPDGRSLATGQRDGSIKLWDVATGQQTLTLHGHTGSVQALAFSRDGKTLMSEADDCTIRRWDID